MIRMCTFTLIALLCFSCGNGGDANSENNAGSNRCETDDQCPGTASIPFTDEAKVSCARNVAGEGYCSECLNDSDCGEGFNCNDKTFCEELEPCMTSRQCADEGELVHFACVNNGCQFCADHPDCDMGAGEMCFNRLCVPRANVDQECIDGNCGEMGLGTCPVKEEDGKAIGYQCVP